MNSSALVCVSSPVINSCHKSPLPTRMLSILAVKCENECIPYVTAWEEQHRGSAVPSEPFNKSRALVLTCVARPRKN